jgi:hypothetical protein
MSLPSPLEKLMDAVESNVIKTVEYYGPQLQSDVVSRTKDRHKSRLNAPKSIDRDIYTYYSLNGECEKYKINLDDFAERKLQKYANELQESEERNYFDLKFNKAKYEERMDGIRNTGKKVASATAGIVTCVGSVYLLDGSLDSAFHGAYIMGTMAGLTALWVESLLNPLGNFLTLPYRKSKLLGTDQYKTELKKKYYNEIRSHLKQINPKNPIISYHDDLTKTCRN